MKRGHNILIDLQTKHGRHQGQRCNTKIKSGELWDQQHHQQNRKV